VRARIGANAWKGGYSLLSLLGFGLLVWGYGQARLDPVLLWTPMIGTRHFAALLMLPSFILLAAAYVPRNGIKARVHHPMVLAVKVWALAHLLANHTLADLFSLAACCSGRCSISARQGSAIAPPAPSIRPAPRPALSSRWRWGRWPGQCLRFGRTPGCLACGRSAEAPALGA
jgi:hypothetical protein